jgi:hypothetical protein
VFEGLLPELHNTTVLRLLFLCAQWHSLAKLRMHNDHTLDLLDKTTKELGIRFRTFANRTCQAFSTRELKREAEARQRRHMKTDPTSESATASQRPKAFNLQTYKFHSLGDYVETIRKYGTCDSYSTEIVSIRSSSIFCSDPILWPPRVNSSIVLPRLVMLVWTVESMWSR